MQIKIEIDVKPEELRRFLGLPDVAGLQEEVINFLRDKVSDANERFDPTEFVKAKYRQPARQQGLPALPLWQPGCGNGGGQQPAPRPPQDQRSAQDQQQAEQELTQAALGAQLLSGLRVRSRNRPCSSSLRNC